MKKILAVFLVSALLCSALTGCANGDATSTISAGSDSTSESATADKDVDLDLTTLSSTMVYSEVYNMMLSPEEYIGKTIKMSGPYYASYYEESGQYYHYVIIEDATACCTQGLEFIWNGDHAYPADYPANNTAIEVTGVYSSYEELSMTFYYIATDTITVL